MLQFKALERYDFVIFSLFLLFSSIADPLFAQEDKKIEYQQLHMLRLKEENDLYQYWYKSDKNFTDGMHIEVVHRIFNIKPADWFLIGFKNTIHKDFGLSIGQDIYTPENTQTSEVDSTDRPYAGLLYFTYTKATNRFLKGQKLRTNFYLGVQGEAAMGKQVQNGVHEELDNPTSKGWDNQLGNGLMLDYEVYYDQILPLGNQFFETGFFGEVHVGTIFNYVGGGLNLKIGHYADTYMNYGGLVNRRNKVHVNEAQVEEMSKAKRKLMPKHIREKSISDQVKYLNDRMNRKVQFFFYFQIKPSYTFYDGTAEGSLIQFSPNTYAEQSDDFDPFIVQGEYGINFQYSRFMFNFNRFLQNDAYSNGGLFGYGEIELAWIF